MSLVNVSGLRKAFGDNVVLDGVDLTVDAGSVTVLIGPSGSGKTTLLRCLNGLEKPQEGVVSVAEERVDFAERPNKAAIRALRAQSGFVFQSHELFPHRTALGNLIEGPVHVLKEPKAEATARAMELLERVGLADKADSFPSALSGGQQQRVGIARALMLRPKLILFDEPTSALDPELVGDVLSVIRDLAREGWTMIVVTHEIQFATEVADQVAFLDGGLVVERGSAKQVLREPTEERTRHFLRRVLNPLTED